jgi:hypothetical protein
MKTELFKAAYLITITLIVAFIVACGIGIVMDRTNPPVVAVSSVVSSPALTIAPTIVPETYTLPSTITYQVKSVNKDNLQVLTTNGDVLYFHDYDEWSTQVKRCAYTARIVEKTGMAYLVKKPHIEVAYIPLDEGRDGMFVES